MTPSFIRKILLVLLVVFLTGCSGYDRALLATKTNVGLDIDSAPPTAEITIARREIAIQPTYPAPAGEESALPLFGSFGLGGSFLNPSITGHFAGGDAAVLLTKESKVSENGDSSVPTEENNGKENSALCLRDKPSDTRGPWVKFWHFITFQEKEDVMKKAREETRPFYFATDTSYGVKVAWKGTGGPYPDSLKLGYNRREFASSPIFVEQEGSCTFTEENGSKNIKGYEVKMPSFYASIDNAGGYTTLTDSGVTHVQFFATGKAAKQIAGNDYVRQVALNDISPDAAKRKAKQIGLNQSLIDEIIEEYNEANATNQSKIMKQAVELDLVASGTTNTNFIEKLKEKSSSPSSEVSGNLNVLRRYAIAL